MEKHSLIKTLRYDFFYKNICYYNEYNYKAKWQILRSDGSSAVILYRLGQALPIFKFLFSWLNKLVNGCVIGRNATFGKGFVIMHPVGVVINSNVSGGEEIVIESGVVIGSADNGIPVHVPVLGSNIFVGTGAKLLGGIHIGNNVKIGAGAVVLDDVPANATAVGIPARIIQRDCQ